MFFINTHNLDTAEEKISKLKDLALEASVLCHLTSGLFSEKCSIR